MAFSFRNLFSQGDEDSENHDSGSKLSDRGLTPKGYFATGSRDSFYNAVTAATEPPQRNGWQPRNYLDCATPEEEHSTGKPDLPTWIPINRLVDYLPAALLREGTALITDSIDLGSIVRLERNPAPAFSLCLSRLLKLIPELFAQEITPSNDQKILIPTNLFHNTKPTPELCVTTRPIIPAKAAVGRPNADTSASSSVSTSASQPSPQAPATARARAQPVSGGLPQRRPPGVSPFTGEDATSVKAQAASQGSGAGWTDRAGRAESSGAARSPFGNLTQTNSGPSSSPTPPPPTSNPFPTHKPTSPAASNEPLPTGDNFSARSQPITEQAAENNKSATVTFNLKRILLSANPDDLGFDPSRIPPHVTVDIQRKSIDSRLLKSGLADLPIQEIIRGCEERHRPAFAKTKTGLTINVPLEEIQRQHSANKDPAATGEPAVAADSGLPKVVKAAKEEAHQPTLPSAADMAREPAPVAAPPPAGDRIQFGTPHSPPETAKDLSSLEETSSGSPAAGAPLQSSGETSQPEAQQAKKTPALNSAPEKAPVFGAKMRSEVSSLPQATNLRATASTESRDQKRAVEVENAGTQTAPTSGTPDQSTIHETKTETENAVANALRQIMQGIGEGTDQPQRGSSAEPGDIPAAAQTQSKPLRTLTHKPFPSSGNPKLPQSPTEEAASRRAVPSLSGPSPGATRPDDTTQVQATAPTDKAGGGNTPPLSSEKTPAPQAEDPAREAGCSTVLEFRAEEVPRQLELRAIFGVSRPIGLQEVVDRCETLPGINGCLVVAPAKVTRASTGNHATGSRADFYQRAAKVYDSVIKLAGEIGIEDVAVLNVKTASGTHSYFRHDNLCLAVMLDDTHLSGGVREKLILVARELPELTENY